MPESDRKLRDAAMPKLVKAMRYQVTNDLPQHPCVESMQPPEIHQTVTYCVIDSEMAACGAARSLLRTSAVSSPVALSKSRDL
jgi:hypothetical protein